MEENIEVKDVQKTEYLDKTGLDMLWAKIKENAHNQVEVERNRAVAKENSIIDTKADKSALDNYVLNTALTALEQKVTANTTAIEGKQDAGKYIPYKEIEGGLTYQLQDSYNIMCQKGFSTTSSNYDYAAINYNCIKIAKGRDYYTLIDKKQIEIQDGGYARALISASSISSRDSNNDFNFSLTRSGIELHNGDDNHVLTSNASTIDITEYAKKTDIPEVNTSDFVNKTTTDPQVINSSLTINDKYFKIANNVNNKDVFICDPEEAENKNVSLSVNSASSDNGVCLTPTDLKFNKANTKSSIILENDSKDEYKDGSVIEITAEDGNPYILLTVGTNGNHSSNSYLKITREGITKDLFGGSDNTYFASDGTVNDIYNTFNKRIVRSFSKGVDTLIDNKGLSVSRYTDDVTNSIRITDSGISLEEPVSVDNESTNIGPDKVFATDGSIANLTEYAKKSEITKVDTSDFVNKNADEAQIINSPLAFTSEVVIASDMEDENTDYIALSPTKLQFSENNYTSSIELNGKDTDVNAECSIEINADHGNPLIRLHSGITGNGNDESALEITNSGISISNSQNENIGPDKVFATNGSVADLAQYVKKSEITADGNVNDVQVNGVSVVENKIANIKPSTKESLGVVKVGDGLNVTDGVISVSAGNYLTYDSVVNEQYFISPHKTFVFTGRNDQDSDLSIGNDHVIVGSNNARMYSKMLDNYIELRADKNALNISCANITGNEYKGDDPTPYQQFVLNKQGVWLYGGDGNHVLTSNASTIDITQYALKSVYDEKIAALEARIATLEAKHTIQ